MLDGTPAPGAFKRMRVQARQIYAFSNAALLGWQEGEAVARDAYGFIQRTGLHPDGYWVRRLSPEGEVLDAAVDLYDQAFVLFALAWYARLTGERAPLAQARRTADWIRVSMRGPVAGYVNVLPTEPGAHRQQNPHMHLLEAALALFEASGDGYWADWAAELMLLFRQRFMDQTSGTLGEYFADDWTPAPGVAGSHVEPGHHYEWVWLLHQYAHLLGSDTRAEADLLYSFAVRHGEDPATGLVWDAVGRDGAARARSARLWPQTEALKAHCVMHRHGDADAGGRIVRTTGILLDRYFAECPLGGWREQFDDAGRPSAGIIPTSSFYHVCMAYAELGRLAGSLHQT